MNRRERRAARKQRPGQFAAGAPADVTPLLAQAARHEQRGEPGEAAKLYKRVLALRPDHAEARNNFGCLLLALGRRDEAADQFRAALELMPELFESYSDVCALLYQVNPALQQAVARASEAWPSLPPLDRLLRPGGVAAIGEDRLLRFALESCAVRDIGLERSLTALRAGMLASALSGCGGEAELGLLCALARQCFINEYVFAASDEEQRQAARLQPMLTGALATGGPVPAPWLAAMASYGPLSALNGTAALLRRSWPPAIEELLTQQVREPQEELRSSQSIPRLTEIEDQVSLRVREQYEQNPYPRWMLPPSRREPVSVSGYLRQEFPLAAPAESAPRAGTDILIAGCGTGLHSVGMARRFAGARVLAVDLSLASLAYAMRKTQNLKLQNIEYAQADILKLGTLDRRFDLIDAGGVLHHLADPFAGWRILLGLLRPGGLMRIGLYSEHARRDVVAARAALAGREPTADGIRRCRQELLASPLHSLSQYYDFFSTSECRDLLFHVQEHRLTLPAIAAFLADCRLAFIGFELGAPVRAQYRSRFPDDPSMTDLVHWDTFEREFPRTFASMYQFWVRAS